MKQSRSNSISLALGFWGTMKTSSLRGSTASADGPTMLLSVGTSLHPGEERRSEVR